MCEEVGPVVRIKRALPTLFRETRSACSVLVNRANDAKGLQGGSDKVDQSELP